MAEPLWTFAEIAGALNCPLPATGRASSVSGVSIDSRSLAPGDLFVAIKGERNDGHGFVEDARAKGAAAAVVVADMGVDSTGAPLFRVPDTLDALNALGRKARARSAARIVAVTGSAGKTGTKEMLRAMLSLSGATHASDKSYNNLWGVPLSLARMPEETRFGIFEIGMNHAGEIAPLTRLVRPHVAIITTVAPVHLAFFDSVAAIAAAKAEIFDGLEPGGHAVLPADSEHYALLAGRARRMAANCISFGWKGDSRLLAVEPRGTGSEVIATILGEPIGFTLGAPGRHLAANAIAALSAAKLIGVDVGKAATALARFEVPEGRGRQQRFETSSGPVLLIDETYNANPASMRAALNVLGSVPRAAFPRRIAILGDMLELGHAAAQFHRELADAVESNAIDLVFCAGPLMAHLHAALPAAKRGGLAGNSAGLTEAVTEAVRGGDAIMIKGSLGSRMALLADALRSQFAGVRETAA